MTVQRPQEADPATDTRALGSGIDEAHCERIEQPKVQQQPLGREPAFLCLNTDAATLGPSPKAGGSLESILRFLRHGARISR